MFQLDTCSDCEANQDDSADEVIMAVKEDQSNSVVKKKRKTIRFQGFIGKHEILILVDSGSVGTFVSESLVSVLNLQTQPCEQLQFTTTDGGCWHFLAQSLGMVSSQQRHQEMPGRPPHSGDAMGWRAVCLNDYRRIHKRTDIPL